MTKSTPVELGEAEARAMALRYLGRREYTCFELARKLAQRGVAGGVADSVVADLALDGLVSDERFAEIFCRLRVERLQGPVKIRAELRARGVDDGIISHYMAAFQGRWRNLAREWVGRRASANPDRKEKARLYRGGRNRGFTHDQIMQALDGLPS